MLEKLDKPGGSKEERGDGIQRLGDFQSCSACKARLETHSAAGFVAVKDYVREILSKFFLFAGLVEA